MSRFFLPDLNLNFEDALPESIELVGEDAFHLSVSLRARIGDPVVVCASTGVEVECRITSISGGKKEPIVLLSPLSMKKGETESPISITLFQGMPKGKKTDSILQKCTELGVDRVVFVYTDRSVPTWDGEENKLARYTKICQEAAKQCGRGKLVQVELLKSLDFAVEEMKQSQCYFACYEEESDRSLKEILSQSGYSTASFLIGPEGGLSKREAALLTEKGIPTVTLGKRILRTETAASTVLSMFLYEKEL